MSEIYLPVITCDKCAPGELPVIQCGEHLSEIEAPAYCVGIGIEQALDGLGWEEREYGHICPGCVKAEKEDAALDKVFGEAVHGVGLSFLGLPVEPDAMNDEFALEHAQREYEERKNKELN
jgi:hypothetical protein